MAKKTKLVYNDYQNHLDNQTKITKERVDKPLMNAICFLCAVAVLICLFLPVMTVQGGVKTEFGEQIGEFFGSTESDNGLSRYAIRYPLSIYSMIKMYLGDSQPTGSDPTQGGTVVPGEGGEEANVNLIGQIWTYISENGYDLLLKGIQTSSTDVSKIVNLLPFVLISGIIVLILAIALFVFSMIAIVGENRFNGIIKAISGVLAIVSIAFAVLSLFMNLPYVHFYYIAYIAIRMGLAGILVALFSVTAFVSTLAVKK